MTFDRVIEIWKPVKNTTASGQNITGYEQDSTVHAKLNPVYGTESIEAKAEVSTGRVHWVVRYGTTISAGWRIVHDGATYFVRETLETKTTGTTGRRRYISCYCDTKDGAYGYD